MYIDYRLNLSIKKNRWNLYTFILKNSSGVLNPMSFIFNQWNYENVTLMNCVARKVYRRNSVDYIAQIRSLITQIENQVIKTAQITVLFTKSSKAKKIIVTSLQIFD